MIRKRRLDLCLRQRDVAAQVGCDEMTVVNWEKGHTSPRINHMAKVVKFLGFSPFHEGGTLAERLVRFRTGRGMTQKASAEALGVLPATSLKIDLPNFCGLNSVISFLTKAISTF